MKEEAEEDSTAKEPYQQRLKFQCIDERRTAFSGCQRWERTGEQPREGCSPPPRLTPADDLACRARSCYTEGGHAERKRTTSSYHPPPARQGQLQQKPPPLQGITHHVCSRRRQDPRGPTGGILGGQSLALQARRRAGPLRSRAELGSTTRSDSCGPGFGRVARRKVNDDGSGSRAARIAETFPAPAAAPTWVTNLSLLEEWPDPAELVDHLARGRLLLENTLLLWWLFASLSLRDRPCSRQLAAQTFIASAARLRAKGELPPFPLCLDAEVMGRLQMLEAKGTPSGTNERIRDETGAGSWQCRAVEVPNHRSHCRQPGSSCGAKKSSSSVRRSTYHRPSSSPADNNEEDMEGLLTSAVTEDQCHHLRATPRYAEHHQFWAGAWILPCLPRPGFRR